MKLRKPFRWIGYVFAIGVVGSACNELGPSEPQTISKVERASLIVQGDTIRCPWNPWRLIDCMEPGSSQEMAINNQLNNFSSPAPCQEAKGLVKGALQNNDVMVSLHDFPALGITFTAKPAPSTHLAETLFVADYMFESWQSENLREALYHEGAHLMHYEDQSDGTKMTAEEFAAMCKDAETESIATDDTVAPGGGSSGGGVGGTCKIRTWYYTDTGEEIFVEVLYCY